MQSGLDLALRSAAGTETGGGSPVRSPSSPPPVARSVARQHAKELRLHRNSSPQPLESLSRSPAPLLPGRRLTCARAGSGPGQRLTPMPTTAALFGVSDSMALRDPFPSPPSLVRPASWTRGVSADWRPRHGLRCLVRHTDARHHLRMFHGNRVSR
jgi:hypothetical protein